MMITSFFKKNNYTKLGWSFILLLLLIPTFFIHREKYPDWGDDFAQYIYQAQQINSPSTDYKKVLNIEEYSSPKRSLAFSLLLSVVTPTTFIQNYVDLISICYIVAGLCFFIFLSGHYSLVISLIGTLCVFYNFLFLRLKSEVVPEFLFIAIFYGILHLMSNLSNRVKYLIPLMLALLVSVRFVGLSLMISYVVFLFLERGKSLKQNIRDAAMCLVIFMLTIFCINYFLLNQISNQELKLYSNLVFKNYGFNTFFTNVSIYSRYFLLFFEQEIPYWMNYIIQFFAIVFLLIGFFMSVKNKLIILHILLVVYFLFLFIYPYNGDTIKYLIPIFPLIIFFIIKGTYYAIGLICLKRIDLIVAAGFAVVLMSNSKTIKLAMEHQDLNTGPFDLTVLEDFKKVHENVGLKNSIAFGKPFIINLLADRNSYYLSKANYDMVFEKADYFLAPKEKIAELYPKNNDIKVANGDTLELTNFYLIKLH